MSALGVWTNPGVEPPGVREDGMSGRDEQRKPGTARGSPRRSRVAAGKAANLVGESPTPSIARFGRLAYPMRGEVTNRAVLGRKRHGRPGHRQGWTAVGTIWVASKLGGLKVIE